MSGEPNHLEELAVALARFVRAASDVWQAYQQRGPARVGAEMFEPVRAAAGGLERLLEDAGTLPEERRAGVLAAVRASTESARRCACTPQGLCFISGEAGLIPRRDQVAAFQEALRLLHDELQQLPRPAL